MDRLSPANSALIVTHTLCDMERLNLGNSAVPAWSGFASQSDRVTC